jgi:hypothetical protein
MDKTANADLSPTEQKVIGTISSILGPALLAGAAGLVMGPWRKRQEAKHIEAIIQNRNNIINSPEVGQHKEKADARFREIVKFAPAVATMPELSKSLVMRSLHSGFSDQDVNHLTNLQASYSKNTAEPAKVLSGYSKTLSGKSAVKTAEVAADVLSIIKTAALADIGKAAKPLLHSIAALTGAHLLLGMGVGTVNTVRKGMEKRELEKQLTSSFQEAMRQSDPSREPLHANKDKAMQAFQALAHFSPVVATQPSAARAFMNSMVSHDLGVPIGAVKEISDIEKNLRGAKGSHPFIEGFTSSLETTGAGSTFRSAVEGSLKSVSEHNMDAIAGSLYGTHLDKSTFVTAEQQRARASKKRY